VPFHETARPWIARLTRSADDEADLGRSGADAVAVDRLDAGVIAILSNGAAH